MSAASHEGWHRSTYPLQASDQGSESESGVTHVPTPVSILEKTVDSALIHNHGSSLQRADTTASWYRAVTADVSQPLSNLPQEHKINLSSIRRHDEDFENGSSTAVSLSHRSVSPYPVNNERESTSASASPSLSEDERDEAPLQGMKPDMIAAGMRKLRRTPPSRRIKSRISLTETENAKEMESPPIPPVPSEHSMAPMAGTSWKRGGYPLQSTVKPSVGKFLPSNHSTASLEPTLSDSQDHPGEKRQASPEGNHEDKQKDSQDASNGLSEAPVLPPPASTNKSEPFQNTQPVKEGADGRATKKGGPWHRGTYPLQAPVSIPNLREIPTPPSSESESESVHKTTHSKAQERNKVEPPHKSWNRRVYPLQAPASIANLRRSLTPPPSAKDMPEDTYDMSEDEFEDAKQDVSASSPWRRRAYPLATSAGDGNSQQESTITAPSTKGQETTHEVPLKLNLETRSPKAKSVFNRQTYPLQSPASIPNLKSAEHLKPVEHSESAEDPKPVEHPKHVKDSKHAEHLKHAEILKHLESSKPAEPSTQFPSSENQSKPQDELNAKDIRERKIAEEVIATWRRQLYPLQSPKYESHQHVEADASEELDSGPLLLPKTVQAYKSSEEVANKGRTIVVCLDGTGDKFDNDNSNIVLLVSALKKSDPHQVTYYQAGIGTYGEGGLSGGFTAAADMAVGSGLGLHVRDAYHFLMHTYKEGDRICLFGFSRGAYTARCLAGMIHKVGLLPPRNIQQIPFAYEFYKKDTPEGWKESAEFKKTFCVDINIHFIGCFDSVASVGFIPRQLPLSSTPGSKARYFRHAMALDERRAKFKVCRYQAKKWEDVDKQYSQAGKVVESTGWKLFQYLPFTKKAQQADKPPDYSTLVNSTQHSHAGISDEEYYNLTKHEAPFDTDVSEVWFAGAHADVGGGAVPNLERHKLAQIPLRWMIRQAFECNTGIIFKTDVLAEFGLDVHTLWPIYRKLPVPTQAPSPSFLERYHQDLPPRHVRRSKLKPIAKKEHGQDLYHLSCPTDEDWTPEQVEDFYDAMTTINDQLIQAPTWWMLEFMPVEYKVPLAPGEVALRVGPNLGRYRGVEDVSPQVHWTVMHRMQHTNYKMGVRTAAHVKWNSVT